MLHYFKHTLILSLGLVALSSQAADSVMNSLPGQYDAQTLVGIVRANNLHFENGGSHLKIENLNASSAKITIDSTQSNGHSCDLEGVATLEGDALVFSEKDMDGDTCRLTIKKSGDLLRLEDDKNVCRKSHCGSRAGLWIDFPYNSRMLPNGKSATTLMPKANEPLCFGRAYSDDHLERNPKQLPSALSLKISGDKNISLMASDRGDRESNNSYSNFGTCYRLNTQSASCALDADAGQFKLQNNHDGSIYLIVSTSMALVLNGEDLEEPSSDPVQSMVLRSSDRDNRIFKLYPIGCSPQ